MPNAKDQTAYEDFYSRVNMQPKELTDFLKTEDSQRVGQKSDGGESTGHASGRRIVAIKHKRKDELTDDDFAHMRKVVNYIKRHIAQKPSSEIEHSNWRYSLMNWGHDPLKDDGNG